MNPSLDGEDLEAIRRVLSKHPVRLGLLYGSAATGDIHTESDIDIGVYIAGSPENHEYAHRFTSILSSLNGCVPRDIDVVDLRTVGPRFAGRITENAEVIYNPENNAETLISSIPIERPTKEELREETSMLKDRLNV